MGKFGNAPTNEDGFINAFVGDAPPVIKADWHGHSGFDAMGHKVPAFRKSAAQEHMKDMGFTREGDAERRHSVVERMSNFIERDNSHQALEVALEMGVDATGCYRILSVLLCAEEPAA